MASCGALISTQSCWRLAHFFFALRIVFLYQHTVIPEPRQCTHSCSLVLWKMSDAAEKEGSPGVELNGMDAFLVCVGGALLQ